MITLLVTLLVSISVLGASPTPSAAQVIAPPAIWGRGGTVVESYVANARVVSVDRPRGLIALQMPNGRTTSFNVHRNVRNLGALRKGDRVTATLISPLAVFVEREGTRPRQPEIRTVTVRPRGMRPVVVDTIGFTGKLQLVDPRDRTLTITGPGGRSMLLRAGSGVRNLNRLRAGDDVIVRYVQPLVIGIDRQGDRGGRGRDRDRF